MRALLSGKQRDSATVQGKWRKKTKASRIQQAKSALNDIA